MPEESSQSTNSLTHVLGKSERVKDIVEECVDDLSLAAEVIHCSVP